MKVREVVRGGFTVEICMGVTLSHSLSFAVSGLYMQPEHGINHTPNNGLVGSVVLLISRVSQNIIAAAAARFVASHHLWSCCSTYFTESPFSSHTQN